MCLATLTVNTSVWRTHFRFLSLIDDDKFDVVKGDIVFYTGIQKNSWHAKVGVSFEVITKFGIMWIAFPHESAVVKKC